MLRTVTDVRASAAIEGIVTQCVKICEIFLHCIIYDPCQESENPRLLPAGEGAHWRLGRRGIGVSEGRGHGVAQGAQGLSAERFDLVQAFLQADKPLKEPVDLPARRQLHGL